MSTHAPDGTIDAAYPRHDRPRAGYLSKASAPEVLVQAIYAVSCGRARNGAQLVQLAAEIGSSR